MKNVRRRALSLLFLVASLFGCAATGPISTGPDIPLATLDGGETSLLPYRGRSTLLHFWATWCASCREELGSLARIAREVPEVAVVAIAIEDDIDAVRTFVEGERIPFPVLIDRGEARSTFSVPSVPFTIFLDRAGRTRPFLDPESGALVSAIGEARYWGSSVAVTRIRESLE